MNNSHHSTPSGNLIVDVTSSKDVVIEYTEPTFNWREVLQDSFIRPTSGTATNQEEQQISSTER